jgi:hypothetical protein
VAETAAAAGAAGEAGTAADGTNGATAAAGEGDEGVWVLGRPNHAAAMQRVRGDSQEGAPGVLATLAVPPELAIDYAARLAAGECILTTCETDQGRMRRDQQLLRKVGALHLFTPYEQVVEYGVRQT